MTNYGEYTTPINLKSNYLDVANSTDDGLLYDIIQSTSREMDRICNRHFFPITQTRYYDTPPAYSRSILFDDDLLDLTSIVDGTGITITSDQYRLYPLNGTPKFKIVLLASSMAGFNTDGSGNPEGAITAAGVWGFHEDYDNAWQSSGATLAAAIGTTSVTSFTCTTGKLVAGQLILIDTEALYVQSVTVGASDTIACVRGVNGTTAATHLINAPILIWTVDDRVEMICRVASAAYYKLRANPVGDTIVLNGVNFSTPRDVTAYLNNRLNLISAIRVSFG